MREGDGGFFGDPSTRGRRELTRAIVVQLFFSSLWQSILVPQTSGPLPPSLGSLQLSFRAGSETKLTKVETPCRLRRVTFSWADPTPPQIPLKFLSRGFKVFEDSTSAVSDTRSFLPTVKEVMDPRGTSGCSGSVHQGRSPYNNLQNR